MYLSVRNTIRPKTKKPVPLATCHSPQATSRRLVTRHLSLVTASLLSAFCFLPLTACRQDMQVQPKYKSLDPSTFFDDGRSERPVVPGTVARGQLRIDEAFYTGKVNGVEVNTFPFPVSSEVLERGRERYNIYCTP